MFIYIGHKRYFFRRMQYNYVVNYYGVYNRLCTTPAAIASYTKLLHQTFLPQGLYQTRTNRFTYCFTLLANIIICRKNKLLEKAHNFGEDINCY